jgi:signal transduction histidine kinase
MPARCPARHTDEVAGRIGWLLAFLRRAEPRRAAPGGWALAFDGTVAIGAAAGAVWETVHRATGHPGASVFRGVPASSLPVVHPGFVVLAAAALTGLPLAFRRYYPIGVWLVIVAAIVLAHPFGVLPVALGTAAYAAYSAIAHSRYRNLAVAAVTVVTIAFAADLGDQLPRFPNWLTPFFAILPAVMAGLGLRHLHHRLADSSAKLSRADAEARAATEAALAAERSRIAAELHDVVTHNVSVMIVQAGAARKILSSSPADAEDALLATEATGREAMTELRNLLGLLSPHAALTPQPGLGELGTLIGRVSAAGLRAELRVTGQPRPLPSGTDLAAYRVVQEGLTNVLRHAGQATATVAIEWGADLVITVTDDGGVALGAALGGTAGRGLLGLRERLAMYGGTLAAGPRSGGGWQLRAVMPVPERSAP